MTLFEWLALGILLMLLYAVGACHEQLAQIKQVLIAIRNRLPERRD